ncbi:iron-containing alcohol dehydrogenase [Flavobacterium sp. MC2016-06]|jgi:alcohol dehydrogenase|uniref:iron-containing alcohol dehydrogenase n=1 Tax=Flavobacterium sp. MC2016-06 TaxID=2676308 RepID=UPI0012BB06B7|nr:iron-containing alcohol dehydrogenase [Flavobacterium sp. MC2016-06]MBU3862434.1 iron-containing alcohol dehydrogenase [Flavobacterium sp. MC2016-06]
MSKLFIVSDVFDGVEEDSSAATSFKGVAAMREFQPDWIIGLGRCSAIDTGKIMWIFYEHPDTDFDSLIKPFSVPALRNKAKFITIPSTSEIRTETVSLAIITDRKKTVNYPILSYELTSGISIIDGKISTSIPTHVTSNTALDTLIDLSTGFNARIPTLEYLKEIYNAFYQGIVYSESVVLN